MPGMRYALLITAGPYAGLSARFHKGPALPGTIKVEIKNQSNSIGEPLIIDMPMKWLKAKRYPIPHPRPHPRTRPRPPGRRP